MGVPPSPSRALLLLSLSRALLLLSLAPALAQLPAGSLQAIENAGWASSALASSFAPSVSRFTLSTTSYVSDPPAPDMYTTGVIFDPCRGAAFNCCNDTFGTPEFLQPVAPSPQPTLFADGSVVPASDSRLPTDNLVIDESCTGEGTPRPDCVRERVSRVPSPYVPACWNYNTSIVADASCAAPADGSLLPLCLALGYMSTAYVVECNPAVSSEGCGTFLEVHRPGRAELLAQTQLVGVLLSGYRMTVITMTYHANKSLTLCYDPVTRGAYEVWWVLRTPDSRRIISTFPFSIISPQCDWDAVNNVWLPFATLYNADGSRHAPILTGIDPWDHTTRVYTQPRVEGTPAYPGVGMGSTLRMVGAGTYPPTAQWAKGWGVGGAGAEGKEVTEPFPSSSGGPYAAKLAAAWGSAPGIVTNVADENNTPSWGAPGLGNNYTYRYAPPRPLYTVAGGVIEPTLPQQAALAELVAARGYRRLIAQGREAEADVLLADATDAALAAWGGEGPTPASAPRRFALTREEHAALMRA